MRKEEEKNAHEMPVDPAACHFRRWGTWFRTGNEALRPAVTGYTTEVLGTRKRTAREREALSRQSVNKRKPCLPGNRSTDGVGRCGAASQHNVF